MVSVRGYTPGATMMRAGLVAVRAASRAACGVEMGPVGESWMSAANESEAEDRRRAMILSNMGR
jgi:hypothetical protein